MVKNILINPDERLRRVSTEVNVDYVKTEKYASLISDMKETMAAKDGIGLAAPQIDEAVRIIVISTEKGVLTFCNPRIITKSWRKETEEEGCLSVPGLVGLVKRYHQIKVSALTDRGESVNFVAKGLFARVIQHEIDHLDGVLFVDKAKSIKKNEKNES